jgi:hypothetical protein
MNAEQVSLLIGSGVSSWALGAVVSTLVNYVYALIESAAD